MDIRAKNIHVHHVEDDEKTCQIVSKLKDDMYFKVLKEHIIDPSYEDPRIPAMEGVLACIDLIVDAMLSIALSNQVPKEKANEEANQLGHDLVERVNQFTHKMAAPKYATDDEISALAENMEVI